MLKKTTWKQRNRLLIAGCVLLLWIIYSVSVRKTVALRAECILLQQQTDSAGNAPQQLVSLKAELARLEVAAGKQDSSGHIHEHLLGVVTNYCQSNGLTLRDFSPPIRFHQEEWTIETHPITVEGTYISLVKLVRCLEKDGTGKVVAVDFRSKRDPRTQHLSLNATIYVQNILLTRST